VFTYIFIAYLVSYATKQVGLDPTFVLLAVTAAGLLSAVTYPLGGALSDLIGRKPAYLIGVVASGALAAPAFAMVNTGNPWLFLVAQVMVMGIALAPMAGVTGTLFATTFDTDIRYSGASIGYTLSQLAGSAFAPTIAAALYGASGSSDSIVGYLLVASVISLVAILLLPGPIGRGAARRQRIADAEGYVPANQ
jgi:MFS family permease